MGGEVYLGGKRGIKKLFKVTQNKILLSISLNISSPSSSPSLFCYLSSHHLTMVQLSTLIISQSGWMDRWIDGWTFEYQVDRLFSRKRHRPPAIHRPCLGRVQHSMPIIRFIWRGRGEHNPSAQHRTLRH